MAKIPALQKLTHICSPIQQLKNTLEKMTLEKSTEQNPKLILRLFWCHPFYPNRRK